MIGLPNWDKMNSIVNYKPAVALCCVCCPRTDTSAQFTIEITDSVELDIAEQKLIYLTQSESFTTDMRLLYPDKAVTKSSRIAK